MADFTYIPSFSTSKAMVPRVKKAQFGDGYQQRALDGINTKLEVWNLQFNNVSSVDAALIETFLELKAGVTTFTWDNPNGVEITVVCGSWSRAFVTTASSNMTMTFEEVEG